MDNLPVLISIPHGGNQVPPLLADRVAASREDLFDDSDPFTAEIYNLSEKVAAVAATDIARTFVDLNRAASDLFPANPDGVIKSHTCFGKKIYRTNREPDESEIPILLDLYYFPYHRRLRRIINNPNLRIELGLDCHSMAETGPAISPDSGKKRPVICLGDVNGSSCPHEVTEKLARCCQKAFGLSSSEVMLNQPFSGGYITREYGKNPVPWIQFEMNRSLYLAEPYFERAKLVVDPKRIQELKRCFHLMLNLFFESNKEVLNRSKSMIHSSGDR